MDMNHKIILKCRLCLDEFEEERMFDLFKESQEPPDDDIEFVLEHEEQSDDLKLSEKVEYCCGVRIRESPEMPSKICVKCNEMTKIWFNFRQMCINSQVYLESLCRDNPTLVGGDTTRNDEFWEYVVEDLQTFRSKARKKNSAYTINIASLKEEIEEDIEDELKCELDEDTEATAMESIDVELEDELIDTIVEESEHEIKPDCVPVKIIRARGRPKKQISSNITDMALPMTTTMTTTTAETLTLSSPIPTLIIKKEEKTMKRNRNVEKRQYRATSPASYMCSICGNVYTKKNSFKYHMSLHSNIKPHECELCGKQFRHVTELNSHMRRHTGEKPYKCNYCDRCFVDRSERHRHERVHTNTRPYECQMCGKRFTHSAILKNHLKYHSGVKDFHCLVCDKSFTLHHQLKAHLQTITHKQKEELYGATGYEVVYD